MLSTSYLNIIQLLGEQASLPVSWTGRDAYPTFLISLS